LGSLGPTVYRANPFPGGSDFISALIAEHLAEPNPCISEADIRNWKIQIRIRMETAFYHVTALLVLGSFAKQTRGRSCKILPNLSKIQRTHPCGTVPRQAVRTLYLPLLADQRENRGALFPGSLRRGI